MRGTAGFGLISRMKFIALFLFVLLSLQSRAQQGLQGKALQDSLLRRLPTIGDDTIGVRLLVDLSYSYGFSDADEGLRYGRRALSLARRIEWRKGEGLALNELGSNHFNKGSYPTALDYFFKALRIFEELGDRRFISKSTGNIGLVYANQGGYTKALEYYFKSLEAARSVGYKPQELTTTGNIGGAYYSQGAYSEALRYMHMALTIAEDMNDRRGVMFQLSNIGNVYGDLGNYPQALESYFQALNIAEQEHDLQIAAANEGNIGETFLDIARDTSTAMTPAGRAANINKAITHLEKGVALARKVGFNEAVIDFLHTLSEAYAAQGAYNASLKTFQQSTALKDSTFNLQNNKLIADLETKRAVELKDKDIQIAKLAVAKKRNERYAYIGGIALLLAILSILFRNYRKQQHTNALLSKEKARSDDLLRNILPAEVAEELKETGGAHARQYEVVSVLFTDFVNFTGAAQQLSPKALVQELHECFTAFDAIMERAGLEKIKTIGDAYMAVCGLPNHDPQHAIKSIQAGLEILQFVEQRRSKQPAFEIRIGINSGPVVAGIVGVKKFAYDIWGDTVNTAARMEQHGIAGAINISRSTYDLVKDGYRCDYRGRITAKHKGEVEMYLVNPLPAPPSAEW